MDRYLLELARSLDSLGSRRTMEDAMDRLEHLHEVLGPDEPEVADRLMAELSRRLEARSP
jgi:hypothetical protein